MSSIIHARLNINTLQIMLQYKCIKYSQHIDDIEFSVLKMLLNIINQVLKGNADHQLPIPDIPSVHDDCCKRKRYTCTLCRANKNVRLEFVL